MSPWPMRGRPHRTVVADSEASTEWEMQVSEVVAKGEDLTRTVRKLEEEYDNELIQAAEEE